MNEDVWEQACWLLLTFCCRLPIHTVNKITTIWCQQQGRTLIEFFAARTQDWEAICELDEKAVNDPLLKEEACKSLY